ncbi:MAG: UV DNA damage repair endonuclease UvsE [Pirellulaceae bacterium]|nr:UV DNA damage repair endonuclease UvsE [Pirellulaceae bacterium]
MSLLEAFNVAGEIEPESACGVAAASDVQEALNPAVAGMRLGLCCQFVSQPIRFRSTTATSLIKLDRTSRLLKLSRICLGNAQSLLRSLTYCAESGIGCFRVISSIMPCKTHPMVGYRVEDLPDADRILAVLNRCRLFSSEHDIRTTFHPDQFVVLNSTNQNVVDRSVQDLISHAEIAEWVGADVINIHAGGAYGDKARSLQRLAKNIDRLPEAVRRRLTIENDDKLFTPEELIPFCRSIGLPLVYDVHHHRCCSAGMTIAEATAATIGTWDREPLMHISSPMEGWVGPRPERHHDYIDCDDFPTAWLGIKLTVEVEAKAKELAVLKLRKQLEGRSPEQHLAVTHRQLKS